MDHPLAPDTDMAIERRQLEGWRRMTPAMKVALVMQMNAAVRQLAMAGIRARFPEASRREQFLRLAELTLGADLARKAYPDFDSLGGP